MVKKKTVRRISGIACVVLGIGAFVTITISSLYRIAIESFDAISVGSIILYSVAGLILLFSGKRLLTVQKSGAQGGKADA